jgi:hypothetical protein
MLSSALLSMPPPSSSPSGVKSRRCSITPTWILFPPHTHTHKRHCHYTRTNLFSC